MLVYHVTLASNLESIERRGLVRNIRKPMFANYAWHVKDRLFVCDVLSVRCWWHKLESMVFALFEPEDVADQLHVPVLLRFSVSPEILEYDEEGSRDCREGESFFLEADVSPSVLEIWDGEEWLLLTEADFAAVASFYIERNEEVAEESEDEMLFWREVDLRLPPGYERE